MAGVTILDTIEQVSYSWAFTRLAMVFVFFALLVTVALLISVNYKRYMNRRGEKSRTDPRFNGICAALLVTCLMGFLFSCRFGEKHVAKTYQVLLEDDVIISEFREHYEILDEQGITYIVRER